MEQDPNEHPETTMVKLSLDGIVTRGQLLRAGVSDHSIGQRVATGFLVRVKPGIFMLAGATLDGRTALRAALSLGPGAAISHWTAAYLDGFTRGIEPDRVHVSLPRTGHLRRNHWLHPHATRRLLPQELRVRDGIVRSIPPRTIRDIVTQVPFDDRADSEVTRVIEEALGQNAVSLEQLEAYVPIETSPIIRGRLERLIAIQRGMPEPALLKSVGEEWLRALLIRNGYPLPKFNHKVLGLERDTVWEDRRLNIEFDGFAFRRVRTKHDSDRRNDRILLLGGWRVARITDADFLNLAALEAEVLRLLQLPPFPLV